MIGLLRRLVRVILAGILVATTAVVMAYAAPAAFFKYEVAIGGLTLRSDRPIDEAAAAQWLDKVSTSLSSSSISQPVQPVTFHVAHTKWREKLFFLIVPNAGGVVYPLISRNNAFLTSIDASADRLSKNGHILLPPRTATYFAVHEATHLAMAQKMGAIRIHLLPRWIREGVADFAALGPMKPHLAQHLLMTTRGEPPSLQMMIDHGSYPILRAKVSLALAQAGCTTPDLLSQNRKACPWP